MTDENKSAKLDTRQLTFGESLLSIILRLLPVKHGKHRLLDRLAPKVWNKSGKPVRISINRFTIIIDPNDLVGWHFAILKSFDPEVVEILAKSYTPESEEVLWDIGFNKGACSTLLASKLPDLKIVAIEPQATLAETNIQNLESICPGRFEYYQVGMGEEEAELTLTIPKSNLGGASLHLNDSCTESYTEIIKIQTASKIRESSQFGWPTIIKIDVEGHELHVFRSLEPCLINKKCKVIVFENHKSEIETFNYIKKIAKPNGYKIYGVKKKIWSTILQLTDKQLPNVTDYTLIHEDEVSKNKRLSKLISSS